MLEMHHSAYVSIVKTNIVNTVVTRNQYASPPQGNAIPAGPFSDCDENLFLC